MADSTDALLELMYELTVTNHVRIDRAALGACREIFDKTVSNFARQAADQAMAEHSTPVHPWENADFRSFILGQVKRIAAEATARAGTAPVSPAILRKAAFDVMTATHKVCKVVVEKGRLKFGTTPIPAKFEGQVCSAFLGSEAE